MSRFGAIPVNPQPTNRFGAIPVGGVEPAQALPQSLPAEEAERIIGDGGQLVGAPPAGYGMSLAGAGALFGDIARSIRSGLASGAASIPEVGANLFNAGVDRVSGALDPLDMYPERVQAVRESMMITDPSIPLPRIATVYDRGATPGSAIFDQTLRGAAEDIQAQDDAAMSPGAQVQDAEYQQAEGFGDTVRFLLQNPGFTARMLSGEVAEELPALLAPGGAIGKVLAGGAQAGTFNARDVRDAIAKAPPEAIADLALLWEIPEGDTEAMRAELLRVAPTRTFERSTAANTLLQGLLPGARKVEDLFSGAAREAGVGRIGNAIRGGAGEAVAGSAGEAADTAIVNDALGRDLTEGMGKAAATGLVLDGGTGAAAGLLQSAQPPAEARAPLPANPGSVAIQPQPLPPQPEPQPQPPQAAQPQAAAPQPSPQSPPQAAAQPAAPRQVTTGAEAGKVIDDRLAILREASKTGRLEKAKVSALRKEDEELVQLLRDRENLQGVLPADAAGQLTDEEIRFIDQRRADIKVELERNAQAVAMENELHDLESRLAKIDDDASLIALAVKLQPAANVRSTAPPAQNIPKPAAQAEPQPAQADQRQPAPQPAATPARPTAPAPPATDLESRLPGIEGRTRTELIQAWQASETPEAEASAAADIAAFDARVRGEIGPAPVPAPVPAAPPVPEPAQAAPTAEPQPAPRRTFAQPDQVSRADQVQAFRDLGLSPEQAERAAADPRVSRQLNDAVTGTFDARTGDMKVATLKRAQQHVAETGEDAAFVSADLINLGGINAARQNVAAVANRDFRAMSDIVVEALRETGADVVPMRTGGDELGFTVINATRAQVDAALRVAEQRSQEYAARAGLATIPHSKPGRSPGVGWHFGVSEIEPGADVEEVFRRADLGVNESKNRRGDSDVTGVETRTAGPASPEGQAGGAGAGNAEAAGQPGREVQAGPGSPAVEPVRQRSGIPAGLPARLTPATRQLNTRFNQWLASNGRGDEQIRLRSVDQASLPDPLARALRAIGDATGVEVEVVRNLTPEVERFNGFTFRDGVVAVNEEADQPATLVAMHEWVHNLRKSDTDLYNRLAAEVRRQGLLPAWAQRMRREGNNTDPDSVVEELTADAVADAFTDPEFLRELGRRDVGLFRQVADSILRFLDSLLGTARDRGTAEYLVDVQAFRDILADVVQEFDTRGRQPAGEGGSEPVFQRPTNAQRRATALQNQRAAFGQLAALGYPQGSATFNYDAGRWEGRRGALNRARENLQDKLLSMREVERDIESSLGVVLQDAERVYRLENLAHGRVSDQMDKLERDVLEPMRQLMREADLSLDQLHDYLLARHAPERNAKVASINPDMQDGGSGILTADAQAIMAGTKEGPYSGKKLTGKDRQTLAKVGRLLDQMRARTLDNLERAGTISAEQRQQIEGAYTHYVPLRGKGEADDFGGGNANAGGGGRVDYAGPRVRRALGRGEGNLPHHIFAEMLGDAERAIVSAELARVREGVLRLAQQYPNRDVWQVEPVDMEWAFSETTGEAYLRMKGRLEAKEDSVLVPVDGKTYRIRIVDTNLRKALLNLDPPNMGAFMRALSAFNRFQAQTLTQYNPSFVAVNLLRDVGFGITGIASEHGAKTAAEVAVNYPKATAAIWRDLRSDTRGDASVPDAQKTWADWAREYTEAGGKTGMAIYNDIETLSRRYDSGVRSLNGMWNDGLRGKGQATIEGAIRAGRPLLDFIDNANDAIENSIRLSLYVSLRKQGRTADQAAEAAKNVTVNFNRKGKWAQALGAVWLFYNASVQGSHRVLKVLADKRVLGGLTALGALQGVFALALMADDDDEDGITRWDSIPDDRKRNSFIIPMPWHEDGYLAVPMPYGFNVFPHLGGRTAQFTRDAQRGDPYALSSFAVDSMLNIARSFQFVPLDDPKQYFGNAAGIILSLATNKDDFGRSISAETYGRPVPASTTGRPDTPAIFQAIATAANRVGMGDDHTVPVIAPVFTDISPDQLAFLWREATGGIGGNITAGMRAIEGIAGGRFESNIEAAAASPLVRSFGLVGNRNSAIANRYFYLKDKEFSPVQSRVRAAALEVVRANGGDLEAAAADWPALRATLGPLAAGLEPERYRANGKRPDGTPYRVGDFKRTESGALKLEPAPGSPLYVFKEAEKVVQDQNNAIREARGSELPLVEREAAIKEAIRIRREAQQTVLRVVLRTRESA